MRTNVQIGIEKQRAFIEMLTKPPLTQICEIHGLSVRDMASIFGISKSYAWEVMRCRKDPDLKLAFRLARYFEVTVDDLFGWMYDDTGERRPLVIEGPDKKVIRLRAANPQHGTMALLKAVAKEMGMKERKSAEAKA
jgi:transcriptional regulator with XRE-family HTH domain